jgi:tetratricopeptide (TPR) repeat protein
MFGAVISRKRLTWLAMTLLLASFGGTATAFADDLEDCMQRKDMDRRIRGCTALIEANPDISEEEYIDRGNAYLAKGDHNRALADFTEYIKRDPKHCVGYGYRAGIYIRLRKFDLAIGDITKGIEVEPNAEFCRRLVGSALCGLKDYAKGIAELTSYLEKFPGGLGQDSQAYIYRGECHEGKGDTAAALADYNASLNIYLTSTAYLARAKLYERIGDKDKAIADYRSALASRPLFYTDNGEKDHAVAQEQLGKPGAR